MTHSKLPGMLLTGCILFLLHACSLLQADLPPEEAAGRKIFEDADSATAAVTGIYEGIAATTNFFAGGGSAYGGIYGDELVYTGQQAALQEFGNSTLSSGNALLETNFWNNSYYFIYRANACIEGLAASETLPASLRGQLMGEAKFLRALLYFYLVHFFGEVPLITSTDAATNERMGRSPVSAVKATITADLKDAQDLLTPAYPTAERARINKWSATALLARHYLYEKEWALAKQEATAVINSGLYRLMPLDSVFLITSKEAILQLQPVNKRHHTMDGFMFIPLGNTRPSFALTPSLINTFEPGDRRKTSWIDVKTVNGVRYYYPFKYKKRPDADTNFVLTEYTSLLRLAELYLLRAECNITLGALPAAISDIDVVRARAGLPVIAHTHPDIEATKLMQVLQHERRTEYFAELGHRWLDLKRTGMANLVMEPLKQGWKSTGELWPIPYAQIALNPSLVQNDGYY
ncbi:RagB/SusD family nutrient uptake outer membrane protein [Chitinophaga sp. S165]|uniref:RagB/SusD family nutrient uptake outer membrane protein n=1 Tax=Chitinophaga sp. S165 TaxID=2135462 RepID=UPI000D919E6C|nr:RagB/SusD family nutrient uptake outer membrane protein [Chitinophaga sp. S165]PWV55554.1 SusD-like starch-binding protein associating with outer membrane [Chitinophaga sp. S165]